MMNTMLKKKWYSVRLNKTNKTFKVSTSKCYTTKSEGMEKIKSNQYDILKHSHLVKLQAEGWTEYEAVKVEDSSAVESKQAKQEWTPEYKTDEETERAIREYEAKKQAQIDKACKEYAKKKAKQTANNREREIIEQTARENMKKTVEQFDYSGSWDKFLTKDLPKAKLAKEQQIKSYTEGC